MNEAVQQPTWASRKLTCWVKDGKAIGRLSRMVAGRAGVTCFFAWHPNVVNKVTKISRELQLASLSLSLWFPPNAEQK